MKSNEVRTSDNFTKYMKYINTYEDGKYVYYEFEDESGNIGQHYQVRPEFIDDKKAKGQARLFNTKMGKLKIGDIAIVVCKAREIHEEQYDNSVFYLNVDRILKPLVRYEIVQKLYNGIMTEFAVEKNITNWDEI